MNQKTNFKEDLEMKIKKLKDYKGWHIIKIMIMVLTMLIGTGVYSIIYLFYTIHKPIMRFLYYIVDFPMGIINFWKDVYKKLKIIMDEKGEEEI